MQTQVTSLRLINHQQSRNRAFYLALFCILKHFNFRFSSNTQIISLGILLKHALDFLNRLYKIHNNVKNYMLQQRNVRRHLLFAHFNFKSFFKSKLTCRENSM